MPDPEAQEPSKSASDLEATVPLRVVRDPYSTQPLNLAQHPNIAAALSPSQSEPTLRLKQADLPVGRDVPVQAPPRQARPASFRVWLPLALGALVVAGGAIYLGFSRRSPKAPAQAPSGPSEAAQAYLEQAKAGDVHAMRMLGAMYYNGLDVPQDRQKGLSWYRKAAEAGSEAARAELAKLEGGR